jgi:hypothetical protein
MGSSHPPKFRCSLSQIGEVHFTESRSSEDCCITKHENRKVHFEHKNIEVQIILGSSLRTKDKTTRKFNSNMWKFAIFSEVHLPPPGSSFTSIRKFTPPYRSSYLKWKFTPYNVEVRLEVQMQIRGSSDLYPEKCRCDGSSLYFLKFTSN